MKNETTQSRDPRFIETFKHLHTIDALSHVKNLTQTVRRVLYGLTASILLCIVLSLFLQ